MTDLSTSILAATRPHLHRTRAALAQRQYSVAEWDAAVAALLRQAEAQPAGAGRASGGERAGGEGAK